MSVHTVVEPWNNPETALFLGHQKKSAIQMSTVQKAIAQKSVVWVECYIISILLEKSAECYFINFAYE